MSRDHHAQSRRRATRTRPAVGLAAILLVLFADCAIRTDGTGAVLGVATTPMPSDGLLDAGGRRVVVHALRLGVAEATLLPCAGEPRAVAPIPLLGVSRAHAHDGALRPVRFVVDLGSASPLGASAPITPVEMLDALPGRYCDLALVFGPVDGAPTLSATIGTARGEAVTLETWTERSRTMSLPSPLALDATRMSGDVVLAFDLSHAFERVDTVGLDAELDPIHVLSDLVTPLTLAPGDEGAPSL